MSSLQIRFVAFLLLPILACFAFNTTALAQEINGVPTYSVQNVEGIDEIEVQTRLADYLISAEGGVLRSVYVHFSPIGTVPTELISDTETSEVEGTAERVLERTYARQPLFPFGLRVNGVDTASEIYNCTVNEAPAQALEIRCSLDVDGVTITKIYSLTNNPDYSFDFRLEIENPTDERITFSDNIFLTLGDGFKDSNNYRDTVRYLYSDGIRQQIFNDPGFNGVGFQDRGLLFFLKPEIADSSVFPYESPSENSRIELGIEIEELSLSPNETSSYEFLLFAGRDKYTLLEDVGLGALNPPGFFLQFIIPIVYLLNWLYDITGNYGWAILLFTLLTRILLFPLFRKQSHSFARMAEIKPKMDKIQQKYPGMKRLKELHPNMSQEELMKRDRENKQAMQEKLMELYRSENVNPLGGCLPLFVQFPILIILWQAILYSAEAIHFTPGFLWMPDLALKDPTYIIMGLTILAMLLQTKTAPKMAAQQQGPNPMFMMLIFAGIMIIALRDFPSGLWVYYFSTTAVQIGQQFIINHEMKRIAEKREAAKAPEVTDVEPDDADDSGEQTPLEPKVSPELEAVPEDEEQAPDHDKKSE